MENNKNQKNVNQDIAILYELSFAIGQSVDLEKNCRLFLHRLLDRKSLSYASVWMRDEDDPDRVSLVYETPLTYKSEQNLSLKHPVFSVIRSKEPEPLCRCSSDEGFSDLITEEYIEVKKGSVAIFPLKKYGVLKLYSITKETRFSEEYLNQLADVVSKFAASLEGNIAHWKENQQNKKLKMLIELGQNLSSNIDQTENNILHSVYVNTSNVMNTDNMYIALYDGASKEVRFGLAYEKGQKIDEKSDEWKPRKLHEFDKGGRTEWIIRNKKSLFFRTESDANSWFNQPNREKPYGTKIEPSWLGVPMKFGDKVLGVIGIHDKVNEHMYDQGDAEILSTIADYAAIAIKNVQLYEDNQTARGKAEKSTDDLKYLNSRKQVLIQLSQTVTSAIQLNEDDICQLIYKEATELMDTDNMYIALYDSQKNIVRFGLAYKGSRRINTNVGEEEKGYEPRPFGTGKTEAIIQSRIPIFHPTKTDAEAWYNEPGRIAYDPVILPSWVGVPMIAGDKVLGVIATYHPEKEHVYSGSDVEILQAMANIAAIALENARLYQQLEEKIEDLKKAQNEIADRERDLVMSGLAMDFIHKMNNIAGTIPPWVSLIKKKLDSDTDPKVIQYLDNISRYTKDILREANDLRNYSENPELIDMEEVTGSVLAQIEMMTSPDIIFDFEPDTNLFHILGIKEHLAVAIHSVITNSVKAISGQGEIAIHLKNIIKKTEKYIEINISDTGCGIPQDKTDAVFEYGTSLWQDKKGTGYGLWRARNIIQSMNGSIEITHNEVGKGTKFVIILPAAETGNKNKNLS